MNRYILIRRLRGPAVLLLIGVLALMDESGAISHFWGWFWPLLMILMGVLLLAERAAMANEEDFPPAPYQGGGYPGTSYPGTGYQGTGYQGAPYQAPYQGSYGGVNPNAQPGTAQPSEQPGTAIVPSGSSDFSGGGNGGQL
jgi:hypothetical protein